MKDLLNYLLAETHIHLHAQPIKITFCDAALVMFVKEFEDPT